MVGWLAGMVTWQFGESDEGFWVGFLVHCVSRMGSLAVLVLPTPEAEGILWRALDERAGRRDEMGVLAALFEAG